MRVLGIVLLLHLSAIVLHGQDISVVSDGDPLNKVLTEIRDSYNINISFDDKKLSNYPIEINQTFPSPEEAIKGLLEDVPLEYEFVNDVFVIFDRKIIVRKKEYRLSGQIRDATSLEPLPYSHIIINEVTLATDQLGNFNYKSNTDSIFKIKASHLGYYILDSSFQSTIGLTLTLSPSSIGLKEVVIRNKEIEKTTMIGNKPGLMKLNHKIAHFLPGFGDNSVFNLLRLMPGILASGESTNDLIIWGSYAGQSQVLFDGFTIFGLKNFNDNISSFNPLMAKDIEVLKGGFDARYGERVGGIVNITGKNGNLKHPSFSVTLNNMTLNGMVEIPIAKKATILFAVRHTWYNLYNPSRFNENLKRNTDSDTTNDIFVVPDYVFRDMNFKYTQNIGENDLFYLSFYGGGDRFSYNINDTIQQKVGNNLRNFNILKSTSETNTQLGITAFYGKSWRNGNTTNFSISYSGIVTKYTDDYKVKPVNQNFIAINKNLNTKNLMDEFSLKVENRFTLSQNHLLEVSGGLLVNRVELVDDTFSIKTVDIKDTARRMWSMVQDNIALGKNTVLKIGSRFTYAQNLNKLYAEPRVSISIQAGNNWKINIATGIYNQFITKSSVVDDLGNYRYLWTICNNEDIPVLQAIHFVLGTSFNAKGWLVSMEPYYKKINGITRYFYSEKYQWEGLLTGESRIYGVDFFVQKDFWKHSAWVSYSLSSTEERWPNLPNNDYRRAPQDQRHEIKLALLLNFDPFYFSTNYVYGSGFPRAPYNPNFDGDDLTYSRWDVSFIYKFLDRKVVGEAGLSLLNVLNTRNIKYANFERVPSGQTNTINIYSEAIPFTPTLYLKFSM